MSYEKAKYIIEKFRSEKLNSFKEDLKEIRNDSGYGKYHNHEKIIDDTRGIVGNIGDHFYCNIPENHPSLKALTTFLNDFKKYIEVRQKNIKGAYAHYKKQNKETPDPINIANRINFETHSVVVSALKELSLWSSFFEGFKELSTPQATLIAALIGGFFGAMPVLFQSYVNFTKYNEINDIRVKMERIITSKGITDIHNFIIIPQMGFAFKMPEDYSIISDPRLTDTQMLIIRTKLQPKGNFYIVLNKLPGFCKDKNINICLTNTLLPPKINIELSQYNRVIGSKFIDLPDGNILSINSYSDVKIEDNISPVLRIIDSLILNNKRN